MGEDKEEEKALWDTVEVKDESIDKRKGEERSSICDILTKSLIGICLGSLGVGCDPIHILCDNGS